MIVKGNKPYPEPKVVSQNPEYAYMLMQNYAGDVSEDTAIHMYIYQHIVKSDDKEFSNLIKQIAIVEMKHLELLGETIKLLGVEPKYETKCVNSEVIPWCSNNVKYENNMKDILLENIKAESIAITTYKLHRNLIGDIYIKDLLERIIVDEEIHLEIFTKMYEKLGY